MLTKMVDGKEVTCSAEEERLIRMKWDLNDRFPEYHGHLMFDGVTEPKHNLDACKFYHRQAIESLIAKKVSNINLNIENAEEVGDESQKKKLIEARKSLKSQIAYDDSGWTKIDDLKAHLEMVKKL